MVLLGAGGPGRVPVVNKSNGWRYRYAGRRGVTYPMSGRFQAKHTGGGVANYSELYEFLLFYSAFELLTPLGLDHSIPTQTRIRARVSVCSVIMLGLRRTTPCCDKIRAPITHWPFHAEMVTSPRQLSPLCILVYE